MEVNESQINVQLAELKRILKGKSKNKLIAILMANLIELEALKNDSRILLEEHQELLKKVKPKKAKKAKIQDEES